MNSDMDEDEARRSALSIARNVLAGNLDPLDGARQLSRLQDLAGYGDSEVAVKFSAIDSETDDLPIGDERSWWNVDALASKDPEISRCRELYRHLIMASCEKLIVLLDGGRAIES